MFQTNKTAAMLDFQTNHVGVEIVGAKFSKFHVKSNELIDIL